MGSTFGATVFGVMLNIGLARSGFAAVSADSLRALVEAAAPDPATETLRSALTNSLHFTFLSMFAVALTFALLNLLIPRVDIDRGHA